MDSTTSTIDRKSQAKRLPRITFGFTWLIVLPGMIWGIPDITCPCWGNPGSQRDMDRDAGLHPSGRGLFSVPSGGTLGRYPAV